MRLPFVSAATYDWAIRHSERLADEADDLRARLEDVTRLLGVEWERSRAIEARTEKLIDTITGMKRENFVVDVPITSTALSVDEADEYAVADEEAKPGLLKRKLGS